MEGCQKMTHTNELLDDIEVGPLTPPGVVDHTALSEGIYVLGRPSREPDWLETATNHIISLSSLQENWDGYGADSPNPKLIGGAIGLLGFIANHSNVSIPSISPTRIGGVIFEWENDPHEIEVEIVTEGAAEYAYINTQNREEKNGCLFINSADDGQFLQTLNKHF